MSIVLTKEEKHALDVIREMNPTLYFAINGHRTHRGNRLNFERNAFQMQIYHDIHPNISITKSTQCGISEWLMATAIGSAYIGKNVFYVLPTGNLVGRFVRERFDKTMQVTPIYRSLGAQDKDQGRRNAMSVSMKQLGPGTIAFVGSNSPAGFTEFAADIAIIDELDRCDQTNILMAPERLSASDFENRREIKVSNPTITGFGIDTEYARTDQQEWFLTCPHCGHKFAPNWFKNVVKEIAPGQYLILDPEWDHESMNDIRLMCDKCGKPVDRYGHGEWVPQYPNRAGMNWGRRGYHISKLFSANVSIVDMLDRFEKAEANEELMTRFWNADLGLAYDAPGARITRPMLDACIDQHIRGAIPGDGAAIAGIDVGAQLHVCIGHMRYGESGIRLIDAQAVRSPGDIVHLLRQYNVKTFVIDGLPETRMSRALAHAFAGGFMCFYAKGKRDVIGKDHVVSVDRTSALDNVKSAIMMKALHLYAGADTTPDLFDHITASTRMFDPEANAGEGAYTWNEGSKPDHYFHAMSYMLMAGRILLMARG